MRKWILSIGSAVALLWAASSVMAQGFHVNGDPAITHSWTQPFSEGGSNYPSLLFDKMVVRLVSGGPIEDPTFTFFRDADGNALAWTQATSADKKTAAASKPADTDAINYIAFNLNFEGLMTSPLSFTFDAYHGGAVVDHALASWDGKQWKIDPEDLVAMRTPEAPSLLLLLPGLLPVAYFLRRRREG